MSMSSGGTGRIASEINVTPLIDVLLVLLIIFMVIVPIAPLGLSSLLPQPDKSAEPAPDGTIVVQVLANGTSEPLYKINQTAFAKAQLEPELTRIFAARQSKVMFVKGDEALEFSQVAEVIDMGHQAAVDSIGLITPSLAAGQ